MLLISTYESDVNHNLSRNEVVLYTYLFLIFFLFFVYMQLIFFFFFFGSRSQIKVNNIRRQTKWPNLE